MCVPDGWMKMGGEVRNGEGYNFLTTDMPKTCIAN